MIRKYIGYICIATFFLVVGIVGAAYYLDWTRLRSAGPDAIPKITVNGADTSYSIGDIITLSINDVVYPQDMLLTHYDWHVVDPNKEEKNFITSKDGTTVSFGTGNKPAKIKVIVNASAVYGTKDSSGNIKDVTLQSSGMSSFDVNIVSSKATITNKEKKVVATKFRGLADEITDGNMNATEAHRAVTTINLPENAAWSRWGEENKKLVSDGHKTGKFRQGGDYSQLCLDIADKLEAE